MRLFITGICGFAGSTLARSLVEAIEGVEITGIDNFIRPGSELNRDALKRLGVRVIHGDIRNTSDFESIAGADWVIDAAANPSVLAGVDGRTSSRQLIEHNLFGTVNILECCRKWSAGFILLSTSRVYSIPALAALPVRAADGAFQLKALSTPQDGVSTKGISEKFSTTAPVSLYGATKLASEALALEYGEAFGFPVWINRCGVLAGARQFGRADQGIFSYWIHSHRAKRQMEYLGFDGAGHQVRDCLHPRDLVPVLRQQMEAAGAKDKPRIAHFSGGMASAKSLRQLTAWCDRRFTPHPVASNPRMRPYDIAWMVLDSSLAESAWDWRPATPVEAILEEIAQHAEQNPSWLDISTPS